MADLLFITHPEVVVDPDRPIERWQLASAGIARARAFAGDAAVAGVTAVWASAETKAIEAAGIVAARHGLGVSIEAGLGENDRSATGYLPPAEFEATADAFFARPGESVRGWERAVDAQARVAAAVARIVDGHGEGNLSDPRARGGGGAAARRLARGANQPGLGPAVPGALLAGAAAGARGRPRLAADRAAGLALSRRGRARRGGCGRRGPRRRSPRGRGRSGAGGRVRPRPRRRRRRRSPSRPGRRWRRSCGRRPAPAPSRVSSLTTTAPAVASPRAMTKAGMSARRSRAR